MQGPALVYVPALICEGEYKPRLEAAALKANRLVQLVTDQVEYRRALAGARQASVRNPDRARSITQVDQRFEHWDVLAVEQLVAGAAFSEDSEHRHAAIMMVRLAISAGRDELGTPRHMQPRCRDVDAAVTKAIKAALERSLHIGHGDAVISKWQRQLTPAFADAAAHWELRHTREELSHARLALRYRDLFDNLKHWLSVSPFQLSASCQCCADLSPFTSPSCVCSCQRCPRHVLTCPAADSVPRAGRARPPSPALASGRALARQALLPAGAAWDVREDAGLCVEASCVPPPLQNLWLRLPQPAPRVATDGGDLRKSSRSLRPRLVSSNQTGLWKRALRLLRAHASVLISRPAGRCRKKRERSERSTRPAGASKVLAGSQERG